MVIQPLPVGGSRFRATTAQFSPTVSTCVLSRSSVMRYTRTYDCPATRCGKRGPGDLIAGLAAGGRGGDTGVGKAGARRPYRWARGGAAWQALGARKRDAAKR